MAVTWCLAFPFCPNEPIRAEAFTVIQGYYSKLFPDVPQLVHSATPVGEPFLRAKTRNELVQMADKFDVVCLIDADTLIHPDGIRHMVDRAADGGMFLGKPFLRGANRSLEAQRALATDPNRNWPQSQFNDPGAAWVLRPSSWWAAGGMDEQFTGWGGEDESFSYLFAALGGTTENGIRAAVKTEHAQPRWRAHPAWLDTYKRESVCQHIWQNPTLATEWLTVRDQPGIVDEWINRFGITNPRLQRLVRASIANGSTSRY